VGRTIQDTGCWGLKSRCDIRPALSQSLRGKERRGEERRGEERRGEAERGKSHHQRYVDVSSRCGLLLHRDTSILTAILTISRIHESGCKQHGRSINGDFVPTTTARISGSSLRPPPPPPLPTTFSTVTTLLTYCRSRSRSRYNRGVWKSTSEEGSRCGTLVNGSFPETVPPADQGLQRWPWWQWWYLVFPLYWFCVRSEGSDLM
jgi:hypothetical protein